MDDPNTTPTPAIDPPAPAAQAPEATPPATDPPAPAAEAAPEGEQPRDDKGRFQKRVDELVRSKGEAEREAAYWRAQALGKQPPTDPAPAPVADAKPKAEDFASYEEFVEALAEHKATEIITKRDSEAKAAQRQAEVATTWKQREAEFVKTAADYAEVVGSSEVVLPQHVLEAVAESDVGPQLAYHLAKNPDVADQLRGMSPAGALRMLGRLEASLSTAPTPAPAPAARITTAPPPVKPVAAPGAGGAADPGKMSMDDYVKHRRQQGASWAR